MANISKTINKNLAQKLYAKHWLSFVVILAGVWFLTINAIIHITGDTSALVSGSKRLIECFSDIGSESCKSLSKFPIWNNLIAYIFGQFTSEQIKLWHYGNIAAFAVYIYIAILELSNLSFIWRLSFLISIIFSPFLFYVNSTFSEIQQGLFLSVGLICFIYRNKFLTPLFIIMSIATKDTFLLSWALILSFLIVKDTYRIIRDSLDNRSFPIESGRNTIISSAIDIFSNIFNSLKKSNYLKILVTGIFGGAFVSFSFNYIRYRQINNVVYLYENITFGMNVNHFASNLWWSLFSPNGGLIFGYGLFFSIVIFYFVFNKVINSHHLESRNFNSLRDGEGKENFKKFEEIVIVIGITLLSGLIATSMWWATFGWDSWGFRLIIPYMMATVVLTILAISIYSDFCKTYLVEVMLVKGTESINQSNLEQQKLTTRKAFLFSVVVILGLLGLTYNLATIQAVFIKDLNLFAESLFSQQWCKTMMSDSRGIVPYYWDCVLDRFQYIPMMLHPPQAIGAESKKFLTILFVALVINLVSLNMRWRNSVTMKNKK